jgi:hypothetical protein
MKNNTMYINVFAYSDSGKGAASLPAGSQATQSKFIF